MVYYELDAMFTFNVAVGFSCLIMAWEVIVIAIKAWQWRKEATHSHSRSCLQHKCVALRPEPRAWTGRLDTSECVIR